MIYTRTYKEFPFCKQEILRYARCKNADKEITDLMQSCIDEVRTELIYNVCYGIFSLEANDGVCRISEKLDIKSKNLCKHLEGCESVMIMAATVGAKLDRLISKYSKLSPSRAFMLQSIGTERIEILCDEFCKDIEGELDTVLTSRFSAGYGDLDINVQKDIFSLLDCGKYIGLTLNDSMLMSPTKSVTAFVGIKNKI